MPDHSGYGETWQTRRHTGAVGLMLAGERPAPKSGAEILETARATDFFEPGRLVTDHETGSVEYVPASFTENALGEMFAGGRLIYRFTINGPPPLWFAGLTSGRTYYAFVDFVEGPDFGEGRWIGRIIDDAGKVVSSSASVEIKQILYFHDDAAQVQHDKPKIEIHGLGKATETESVFRYYHWAETLSDWHEYYGGCQCTHTCMDEYIPESL